MAVKDLLKNFWANKALRNAIILVILLIIFFIVLIINLKPPEPRKSERVLICDNCKEYTSLRDFTDIRLLECPKCKKIGHLKYAMKCTKCDYEFPYIDTPLSEEKKKNMSKVLAQRILDRRCPNCGSLEVRPMSNYLWQKKHGKKKK